MYLCDLPADDKTDFVGEAIDYEDHVYFFFRENAKEYEHWQDPVF